MNEISVLIGGKAGFGIDKASLVIASLISQLGYRLYIYRDYPSVIRGGHTFSIIRAREEKVASHRDMIDVLLALNQDAVDIHKYRLDNDSIVIYDSNVVDAALLKGLANAIGLPFTDIIKEEAAGEIMRNTCILGAFTRAVGIEWDLLDQVFRKNFPKELDQNLKVARRGFDASRKVIEIARLEKEKLPILTGNETTALGFIKGGLNSYLAYPMTPSSPILHYLANAAEMFGLKVVHPESEIAVIMMALGMAYCGEKVAVGTSGGGFCLMTEGLSCAGMAELPVVIVLGQRPGPSTGLPTYSCQTELQFALSAGQGEFVRFIVAPGDAEEAYWAAQLALAMSWKYQIPSIILTDKAMAEGAYSFDGESCKTIREELLTPGGVQGNYKRYADSDTGVSALAVPPMKDAIIKVNSYEHDEFGITTEDPAVTVKMQDKRLRKEKFLGIDLESYECVSIHGNKNATTALLCWGSNKGVCIEAARALDLKVIQVLVMAPFPVKQLRHALEGVGKLIAVENNATAQLVQLINRFGFTVNASVLKYDGRNFGVEELEGRLRKVIS